MAFIPLQFVLLRKSSGNNRGLLHSRPRAAPDFVAQVVQEGAQMKGFLSGFIHFIASFFYSASQVLILESTRTLVL